MEKVMTKVQVVSSDKIIGLFEIRSHYGESGLEGWAVWHTASGHQVSDMYSTEAQCEEWLEAKKTSGIIEF